MYSQQWEISLKGRSSFYWLCLQSVRLLRLASWIERIVNAEIKPDHFGLRTIPLSSTIHSATSTSQRPQESIEQMKERHLCELWSVDVRNPEYKRKMMNNAHDRAHTGPKPWED